MPRVRVAALLAFATCLLLALRLAPLAEAQTTFPANAASLGAIPDGGSATVYTPGAPRDVTFFVTGITLVQSVRISMTISPFHPWSGDVTATLIAPDGTSHVVFGRRGATTATGKGAGSDLAGPYEFSDQATLDFWAAVGSPVPAGHYRTVEAGGAGATGAQTLMNPVFANRGGNGTWTLRFVDGWQGDTGTVSAASLTLTPVPFTSATPSTLGAIPDGPSNTCMTNGPPRIVEFPVSGKVGPVVSVAVSASLTHAFVGDVTATLVAPNGTTSHVLFGYTGATFQGSFGDDSDLSGIYTFLDASLGNWWTAAAAVNSVTPIPSGSYRTSQIGGFGATGALTSMNPVFAGTEPNGTWLLRLTDGCNSDAGSVIGAEIVVTTSGVASPPTGVADAYATAHATTLSVPAPGVLGNDVASVGGGTLTAALVTGPAHGTLTLNANGSFSYTPAIGFTGADSFTYRPVNAGGPGSTATASISVAAPISVQPPTAFRVDDVAGSQVTLRWDPPAAGPAPTGYLIEGGVIPGTTAGSIPVGPVPFLSFAAPSGSFFLRVKSLNGGSASAASNEVPLHVHAAVAPSTPGSVTGLANGSSVALAWKLSYGGGEPTGVILDVSGAAVASVPLGPVESFAFNGLPAGTYTFAVRATNGAGTSGASAPVTLTFPVGCSGAPASPRNFLFFNVGSTLHLVWDPPASGPAATAYQLNVSGVFNGAVPVGAARSLSASVPSGFYSVSVTALNPCSASAPTGIQTVVVP